MDHHDEHEYDDDYAPVDPLLPREEGSLYKSQSRLKEWLSTQRQGVGRYISLYGKLRPRRRRWLMSILYLLGAFATFVLLIPFLIPTYASYPAHFARVEDACAGTEKPDGCANLHNEKIFLTVSLYDPQGDIAGGQWGQAVLDLIHLIGRDNVFVSIYENDSGEKGAEALRAFQSRLPHEDKHSIIVEGHIAVDDYFPNVTLPSGEQRVKRLAYLSDIRNRALKPLDLIDRENPIDEFDKILFLNDAIFDPMEAAHLLFSTNAGASEDGRAHYLSVCAMDYTGNPFKQYDTFAERDVEGFAWGTPIFPYYTGSGKAITRRKMLAASDAVPMRGCWGGMVAMQAKWVQNKEIGAAENATFADIKQHVIDPDHPRNVTTPVRFRYEPELFLDSCECCLFLADVSTVAARAGEWAIGEGVFVNPYVRVAYEALAFERLWIAKRFEVLLTIPQMIITNWKNLPKHNPYRTVVEGEPFKEEVWNLEQEKWEMKDRVGRNGLFCAVREMQLVDEESRKAGGKNWALYKDVPWDSQEYDFPY